MDAALRALIQARLEQIVSALDEARSPDVQRILLELRREHEAALSRRVQPFQLDPSHQEQPGQPEQRAPSAD